jgi:RES domain-containing protein
VSIGAPQDPVHLLGTIAASPWAGETWRNHGRRYGATDPGGSRLVSGRYHRAPDRFPNDPCWPALYLSLSNGGAIAELTRRLEPTTLTGLNNRRLTRIRVSLSVVLDLRDPSVLGLTLAALIDDYDYSITQALAAAALQRGVEGLLVPAASLVSANLVVLIDNLLPASAIEPLDAVDPRLYVPRS